MSTEIERERMGDFPVQHGEQVQMRQEKTPGGPANAAGAEYGAQLAAAGSSKPVTAETQAVGLSEASKRLLPWLVGVALFMESLDTTILNTAVPAVSAALHVGPLSMKSVLASYTLSLAVFIPISGWMADKFGTRKLFASAIGIFTFGSLLCGMCSNIHLLVACRVLQGCGGAMMVPVGRLTLVRTFAKSELLRAMSFISIPALVAPMLGPIAGGLIVGYLHWRYIFFLNVPIGLIGLVLVYMHLPNFFEENVQPLDFVGLILFGAGIALLSYVLEIFGEHALSSREITGLLALSIFLLIGYVIHARHTAFPLLDLGLFRIRTFRAAVTGGFVTRLGMGGIPFLLPLLYQLGLGYTAIQSGLLIMPQAIGTGVMKIVLTRLLDAIGYRGVLISNTIIIGLLIVSFATIGQHSSLWYIVALAFFYGLFSSLQYTSMNTLAYADTTETETSNASSIASTVQQMAISFGVAIAGLVTAFFIPSTPVSRPEDAIHGLHRAFILLGGLTVLSTSVFGILRKGDGDDMSRRKVDHSGG
ncbi:MAG: DHA2 family efflux MFS transporter permease subunit [Terracidiphilus sp.]